MMKRVMMLMVIFLVAIQAAGQHKPKMNFTAVFYDDINEEPRANDFATAFALEPLCSGLTLYRWSMHRDDVFVRHAQHARAGWFLYGGFMLWRHKDGDDLSVAASYDIDAKHSRVAAHQVCFIMKERGGKTQ